MSASLLAAASSPVAAWDTVSMILPTAAANSSASLCIAIFRSTSAARVAASSSSTSRRALSRTSILNCSTAWAISPISSLRPSPGKTTSKLPFASFPIAAVIAESGLEIARPVRNANAETAATMNSIAICVSDRVAAIVCLLADSASMRVCSTDFCMAAMSGSMAA